MNNKEIARKFSLLAKLMELHGENAFKTKSYSSAYLTIRKYPKELSTMELSEIENIQGIGKAISTKTAELLSTGEIQLLSDYIEKTPAGIVKMIQIKGFGPKKIATIWRELEIETIGELMYAINENRLVELKGFGAKTQASLKEQLEYYMESSDKVLYASAESIAHNLIEELKSHFTESKVALTGDIYRKAQIVNTIEIISDIEASLIDQFISGSEQLIKTDEGIFSQNLKVTFHYASSENFYYELTKKSCGESFWKMLNITDKKYESEEELFESNDLPYIIPEYREDPNVSFFKEAYRPDTIIDIDDIRGSIHNHSTYSDGVNTLMEMTQATMDKGYEYLVITDHSKSAFYANGLSEERLMAQLDEIIKINQSINNFRLFSGIESDILSNGSLDYPDEVLSELEVIVASVHSNLKMDIDKATKRLITAIENPYTSILGHPTGRLLLSRKGYPIDHHKVIDACAANNVAIEINANPLRLDIDWTYVQYAVDKGVLISINPDAHSTKGLDDTYYGVCSARKAGLSKYNCLNAYDTEEMEEWIIEQHQKRP
jgi:DNA polymerase (family 10)